VAEKTLVEPPRGGGGGGGGGPGKRNKLAWSGENVKVKQREHQIGQGHENPENQMRVKDKKESERGKKGHLKKA